MSERVVVRAKNGTILMVVLGLMAALRAWFMGPMWLDNSLLALSFSDRIGRGHGLMLAGQDVACEAFTNPAWVAFFGLMGRINLSEVDLQAPLALFGYALLAMFVFSVAKKKTSAQAAFFSVLMLGIAPVAAGVRDGSDAVWLALAFVWAASSVENDVKTKSQGRQSAMALGLLCCTGISGQVVAAGLALLGFRLGHKRNLTIVAAVLVVLNGIRRAVFGTWVPPVLIGPESISAIFSWMPALCLLSLLGLVVSWRRAQFPYIWALAVGWVSALVLGQEAGGFGVALLPAIGVMAVFVAHAMHMHRSLWFPLLMVLLVVGIDGRQGEQAVEDIRRSRLSHYLQGRGMGRFLLWRFGSDDRVVVHRPGVIGYYSRRPLIDMSGRLGGGVTPEQALQENPVAVLPVRSIVSQKAQRVEMPESWPDQLEQRYKQYAIQHQKPWKMVDVDPVWFHIYIRKDLPMLRADIPASNGNILPPEPLPDLTKGNP